MYEYAATVVDVHDGDTITVDIDLGLDMCARSQKLRLNGINAPELNTPAGKLAREYLADILLPAPDVTVQTIKDRREKYGRYLAVVIDSSGRNLNELLVSSGHALRWNGEGPRPV